MSRVDSNIVSSVLADIDTEYGKIVKMTIKQINIHKYLEITIAYHLSGKVNFSMVNNIGNMLDEIPEDTKGESETSSTYHLFVISEDATKLSRTNTDLFHTFL